MSLPATLTLRQWERRRVIGSCKTQSGALIEAGAGIGASWTIGIDTPGLLAIFPIEGTLDAELVAIGAMTNKAVSIVQSIYGVDPSVPGGTFNKAVRNWSMTVTITSDALQIPDASFQAE